MIKNFIQCLAFLTGLNTLCAPLDSEEAHYKNLCTNFYEPWSTKIYWKTVYETSEQIPWEHIFYKRGKGLLVREEDIPKLEKAQLNQNPYASLLVVFYLTHGPYKEHNSQEIFISTYQDLQMIAYREALFEILWHATILSPDTYPLKALLKLLALNESSKEGTCTQQIQQILKKGRSLWDGQYTAKITLTESDKNALRKLLDFPRTTAR